MRQRLELLDGHSLALFYVLLFLYVSSVVPIFYYLSINLKEKRFPYTSSERRTFEQNLEFYPVTRRAWNRAVGNHFKIIRM